LKARNWNVQKALEMLVKTLNWRDQFKPDEIQASELIDIGSTGKVIRAGFDKYNRPLIVITPARENSTDYAKNMRLVVYTLEKAIQTMGDGVEQLVLLVDFNGYSLRKAPPIAVAKEFVSVLSDHYPERLGAAVLVDPPKVFSFLWNAVKLLVDANTRKKIYVVKPSHFSTTLPDLFDMKTLDHKFGGGGSFTYENALLIEAQMEPQSISTA
jgi:hypothetical protein